ATRSTAAVAPCGPALGRVVEAHGERDALAGDVDGQDLDADDVTGLGDVARVGHEGSGHGRHVHEAVLVDADVDEGAEGRHVGDDALQHHARLKVRQLV